jgi:endonuclease YncB( thermonuclease family)
MPRSPWRQNPRIPRRYGVVAGLAVAALLAMAALLIPPTLISGRAEVVDGDTLRIGHERIRLTGLDAPELAQTCTDANGGSWDCGREAKAFVVSLVAGRTVTCSSARRDVYGRPLAKCDSGAGDLGAQIVDAGWAVADFGYFSEASDARLAKRGIWSGSFIAPADWRRMKSGGWPDLWGWITSWFHS